MDRTLKRILGLTVAALAVLALVTTLVAHDAPAAAAAPVTYGLGDANGHFALCPPTPEACCDTSQLDCDVHTITGYFRDPLFDKLTEPSSAHPISEIRLFVSYDALREWNGSTTAPACQFSRALLEPWTDASGGAHEPGEQWRSLLAGLVAAHAEGLTPIVSITGYHTPNVLPTWDQPAPDPTTTGGWWEYHCGVQGILDAVSALPAADQPHVWEPFNEPDGFATFRSLDGRQADSCAPSATPQPNGAAKAACLYVEGEREIHEFAGHEQDTVLAGTFIHPSIPYLDEYAAALGRVLGPAEYPTAWSVHDYADVTASYGVDPTPSQLAAFDDRLATDTGGRATALWVTEAGTVLTDRHRGGDCPAVGPDAAGTIGACVDGQPAREAASANAFLALSQVAHAVPITHLFWYQWESATHWDSGLVDSFGHPRAGYCALYGSGTCDGDPSAPLG